jgi:hypothetical protein
MLFGTAVLVGGLAFFPLQAAEREVRDFQIRVGNRPAGQYQLTITRQDDGSISVQARARVTVSYLVYSYKYYYNGTEKWRGDRLAEVNSSANDNGTRYHVTAAAEGNALRVWVNDTNQLIPGDVWTTTYWRLPDARFRNREIRLLDVDVGQEITGTLQFVESKAVTILGQPLECAHYHLSGSRPNGGPPLSVDLWYDPQGRLVWEDAVEEGRHIVFQLTQLGQ